MKKNIKFIVILTFVLLLVGCISIFTTDNQIDENEQNNELENSDLEKNELEIISEKNDEINMFLNDYNSVNPALKITKDMVSPNGFSTVYIHNSGFRNFEILNKTDDGKEMISIQIEKHTEDKNDFRDVFNSLMKVFIPDISNEKLEELFNDLINGNYVIDYSENNQALKYQNVYLSFNDSGTVDVFGKTNFCFIRLYGEYKIK